MLVVGGFRRAKPEQGSPNDAPIRYKTHCTGTMPRGASVIQVEIGLRKRAGELVRTGGARAHARQPTRDRSPAPPAAEPAPCVRTRASAAPCEPRGR